MAQSLLYVSDVDAWLYILNTDMSSTFLWLKFH